MTDDHDRSAPGFRMDRRAFGVLAAGAGLTLVTGAATVAAGAERAGIFSEFGVAIRGADPVAFFTEGAALEGRQTNAYTWRGAKWLFVSAANRDRFAATPETFLPAYGGWCAWAMTRGILAKTDPTAWLIEDGRLYLNFDHRTRQRFQRDVPGNIAKADEVWQTDFS